MSAQFGVTYIYAGTAAAHDTLEVLDWLTGRKSLIFPSLLRSDAFIGLALLNSDGTQCYF